MNWLKNTKVYVVNLRRRKDRLAHMKTELLNIGIQDFEIITAVDAKNYELQTEKCIDAMKCEGNDKGNVDPGWLAHHITMSTTFDWLFRLGHNGNTLLLEDDCIFVKGFSSKFQDYYANVPDDWGCILSGITDVDHKNSKAVNRHFFKAGYPLLRHFMLLTPYAVQELYYWFLTFRETFDNQTAKLFVSGNKFQTYTTKQPLVFQELRYVEDAEPMYVDGLLRFVKNGEVVKNQNSKLGSDGFSISVKSQGL